MTVQFVRNEFKIIKYSEEHKDTRNLCTYNPSSLGTYFRIFYSVLKYKLAAFKKPPIGYAWQRVV